MSRTSLACTVFLLASVAVHAQDKQIPQEILAARYIMVVTEYGTDLHRALPEDRRAVAAVEEAVRKWDRYTLTYSPENADLLLSVRVGRLGAVTVGGRVGTRRPEGGTYGGPMAGAEAGMPFDMLRVYRGGRADLASAALLLTYHVKDGLELPDLPVLQQFRRDVEATAQERAAAEEWKKAARAIEKRVGELAAARKLASGEAARLTRLVSDRVKGDQAMRARVAAGNLEDIDRLFQELR